jgi:hypothetical protein
MPIKNYITTEEKKILQHELKYQENPDIRERILMLLSSSGKKE